MVIMIGNHANPRRRGCGWCLCVYIRRKTIGNLRKRLKAINFEWNDENIDDDLNDNNSNREFTHTNNKNFFVEINCDFNEKQDF